MIKKNEKNMRGKGKLLSTILFIVLSLGLIYLTFFTVEKTQKGGIEMVGITGNNLLSENDYLAFANLDDISNYKGLTLPVVKDRLEKHPYVLNADVEQLDYNKVKVILTEKKIMAVVLSGSEPYIISEDFIVLPLLSNTKFSDFTVISNPAENEQLKPLSYFKNKDMVEAFKIIEAAKLTNVNILKRLSEINLRNGGEILLSFSGMKTPVIFGRGEEAKKMVYLEIMWEEILEGRTFAKDAEYIDLRFANEVYVGAPVNIGQNTGLN